jgi:cyclohexanone monooxygenase
VQRVDAVVVGAGFAGLYALYRVRGEGLSVRVLEAGDGIGGTWYWNCYPGARCDVESVDYSYSFDEELEQEWLWTERYPAQPEILRYLNHVADRFDLWPDIQLGSRVTAAAWVDDSGSWTVTTEAGEEWSARFLVLATGCLSARQIPAFAGLESFEGEWHHTAEWPREGVDVVGKRVGVIGTGSTGIQIVPELAPLAVHLYVFQRTANFSVPNRDKPLEPEALAEVKARYSAHRQAARESFLGVHVVGAGKPALEARSRRSPRPRCGWPTARSTSSTRSSSRPGSTRSRVPPSGSSSAAATA